jgi:hypothetical protein
LLRISKKTRENLQFEIFRDICEHAPAGMACADEAPDFVVRQGNSYVGVELTQYFKPAVPGRRPIQEQHALQAMIVERARNIYEAARGERLRVNALFHAHTDLGKRDAVQLATALAGFVQVSLVSELQQRFEPRRAGADLHSITAVYAYRCTGAMRSLWRIATAGAVRPLVVEDIESVIASKDRDIPKYDERAAENILVIVLDGSAASFASLTDAARANTYVTAFKQIHFLDIANGTCTDLRAVPPNPALLLPGPI